MCSGICGINSFAENQYFYPSQKKCVKLFYNSSLENIAGNLTISTIDWIITLYIGLLLLVKLCSPSVRSASKGSLASLKGAFIIHQTIPSLIDHL